jgi:hypothetical protein
MKKYRLLASVIIAGTIFYACSKGDAGPAGPDAGNTATAVFQDGASPSAAYAGTTDIILAAGNPDTNTNGYGYLLVGRSGANVYRSVIRFDLSYIVPSNVTVLSAYLDLENETEAGSNTIRAYVLSRNFTEAQATWNSYSTGNLWTTAGGDFGASQIGQAFISSGAPLRITLSASAVQAWIANPADNRGLLLKADNESTPENWYRFDCSEDGPPTGPKLTVNYLIP